MTFISSFLSLHQVQILSYDDELNSQVQNTLAGLSIEQ